MSTGGEGPGESGLSRCVLTRWTVRILFISSLFRGAGEREEESEARGGGFPAEFPK